MNGLRRRANRGWRERTVEPLPQRPNATDPSRWRARLRHSSLLVVCPLARQRTVDRHPESCPTVGAKRRMGRSRPTNRSSRCMHRQGEPLARQGRSLCSTVRAHSKFGDPMCALESGYGRRRYPCPSATRRRARRQPHSSHASDPRTTRCPEECRLRREAQLAGVVCQRRSLPRESTCDALPYDHTNLVIEGTVAL